MITSRSPERPSSDTIPQSWKSDLLPGSADAGADVAAGAMLSLGRIDFSFPYVSEIMMMASEDDLFHSSTVYPISQGVS